MNYYKLTDQNMKTYNNFQWELNKKYKASGEGDLCGEGWLHFYHSSELALFLNPIHADFTNPRLFLAETGGKSLEDMGLKIGFTSVKLIKELEVVEPTFAQRVAFAILCAKEVYKAPGWGAWAASWLRGEDRTAEAAKAAAEAASWAAEKAASWAAGAAKAAAWAAWAAAKAAAEAEAEAEAEASAAAWAAGAAKAAAEAAAEAAAAEEREVDFLFAAKEAMKY